MNILPAVLCTQGIQLYTSVYKWAVLWILTWVPVQWQQSAPLCPDELPGHSRRLHVFELEPLYLQEWLFHSPFASTWPPCLLRERCLSDFSLIQTHIELPVRLLGKENLVTQASIRTLSWALLLLSISDGFRRVRVPTLAVHQKAPTQETNWLRLYVYIRQGEAFHPPIREITGAHDWSPM